MRKATSTLSTFLCVFLFISFSFVSCSSDDDETKEGNEEVIEEVEEEIVEDEPGKIPGLGSEEGELSGKPFKLPKGIELVGEIKGYSYGDDLRAVTDKRSLDLEKVISNSLMISSREAEIDKFGSGSLVSLGIKLKNTTNKDIQFEFPAGLIMRSRTNDYQNGILLKKVTISIPANNTYSLVLYLYCGNFGRHMSSPSAYYEWGVVTNSSLIIDLCKRMADKKINYEEFPYEDFFTYKAQVLYIQGIVWRVTDNFNGLTQEDIDYINSLPKSK